MFLIPSTLPTLLKDSQREGNVSTLHITLASPAPSQTVQGSPRDSSRNTCVGLRPRRKRWSCANSPSLGKERIASQGGPIKQQLLKIRDPGLFIQWGCKLPAPDKSTLIWWQGSGFTCWVAMKQESSHLSPSSLIFFWHWERYGWVESNSTLPQPECQKGRWNHATRSSLWSSSQRHREPSQ